MSKDAQVIGTFRCSALHNPLDGHALQLIQGVDIEKEGQDDLVWMVFWYMGYQACDVSCPAHLSRRDRIRNAWRALRGKRIYAEEFVFDRDEARRLGECLYLTTTAKQEESNDDDSV